MAGSPSGLSSHNFFMKINIDPKKKLFRWGPIDSRPVYPSAWLRGMLKFNEHFKPGWPVSLGIFEQEKNTFIVGKKELYDNGEKAFRRLILNDENFKKYVSSWNEIIKNFDKIYSNYNKLDFKKLSDAELAKTYKDWQNFYSLHFWFIGLIPELANWGGEQLLERELRKNIKKESDFNYAFERLSSPEDFSFYQKEELDLLALKKIKNKQLLAEKLRSHQQKYFWLLNSYHHTRVLPISYFSRVLKSYSVSSANQKIKEIKMLRKLSVVDKNKAAKKFDLSEDILKIGKRLAFSIWWQDFRKGYIFRANHIIDLFLKEISRRYRINFSDLHYYLVNEVSAVLEKNKKLSAREMSMRRDYFLEILDSKKGLATIAGNEAKKLTKPFTENNHATGVKMFKGLVVNGGFARGKVKIIFSTKDLKKMKKGDILVSSMTAPDYITGLRKAAAVVTDEGGMTCHAAIVSRELKIPGIVGTKIATQILKDGDLVEVDAINGIVKKL